MGTHTVEYEATGGQVRPLSEVHSDRVGRRTGDTGHSPEMQNGPQMVDCKGARPAWIQLDGISTPHAEDFPGREGMHRNSEPLVHEWPLSSKILPYETFKDHPVSILHHSHN